MYRPVAGFSLGNVLVEYTNPEIRRSDTHTYMISMCNFDIRGHL